MSVSWADLTAESFPYTLRQLPGEKNSLGRIKFVVSNKYDIYLHDTPNAELFARQARDFSYGCIRLEDPVGLAEQLLEGSWNRDRLMSAIATLETQTVPLPRSMPLHIVYWTAWVDDHGILQFRDDVYQVDELQQRAVRQQLQARGGAVATEPDGAY